MMADYIFQTILTDIDLPISYHIHTVKVFIVR